MTYPDRLRWEPAIYEHKAALIGRSPAEVAVSADLLLEALEAEHATYRADFMTVGLDVYNVEAEACGAELATGADDACPEIPVPPWSIDALPPEVEAGELAPPDPETSGRFPLLLEAGRRFRDRLAGSADGGARGGDPGASPVVRVAASGPVSIAAKLAGTEPLLMGLFAAEPQALALLDFTTAVCLAWVAAIRRAGLDAIVFDSSASPPMIGPDLYRDAIGPLHERIMGRLAQTGQRLRSLVLGGDTTPIAGQLAATGANQLVCDYAAGAGDFAAALAAPRGALAAGGAAVLASRGVSIRRNVNPALLSDADLSELVADFCDDLGVLPNPVGGTGILPYDQDPAKYLRFRRLVEERR